MEGHHKHIRNILSMHKAGFWTPLKPKSPRVTSYAELGGSWNSEVNNGIHARQGSV